MSSQNITELLIDWSSGRREALDKLIPLVESELHQMAHNFMRRESSGHMLQTTALVNEAYLCLVDQTRVQWQNRAHFFGVAAHIMRRVLLGYARSRHQLKNSGNFVRVDFENASSLSTEMSEELIAIDEALDRLTALDERKGKVVELRFFGGLSNEEIAEVLKTSTATVSRDWEFAKDWLRLELQT